MKRNRMLCMAAVVMLVLAVPGLAQNDPPPGFPIVEDFTEVSEWTLHDNAVHDAVNGRVQLTNSTTFKKGLIVLNAPFSSTYGITVEFDFFSGGGTGADGIAFFLVDGTTDPVIPGAYGCSLGYSSNFEYEMLPLAGVSHGYVGIGFDEIGGFLTQYAGPMGLPEYIPDTVTMRGSGNGIVGYNYLTHALTNPYGGIDGGWRRARITVTQGTLVSVQMSWNNGTTWVPLITDYDLSAAPGQAPLPATFKLGFLASTGALTNFHLIDNVNVSVPVDVVVDVTQQPDGPFCPGENVSYQFTVANNGPNGSNSIQVSDKVPAGLENVAWNYTTNLGDSDSGTGNIIEPTLDLDSGEIATFTVSGDVALNFFGSLGHDVSADTGPGFNDPTPGDASDSVVIEVVSKSLTVTSPNGGENWKATSSKTITWNADCMSGLLKITLWKSGLKVGLIAYNVDPAAGSFAWKAGQLIDGGLASCGNDYRIKIKEIGTVEADSSDANFTLSPGITVEAPIGGETWKTGDVKQITWSALCLTHNVKITLWQDNEFRGIIAYDLDPAASSFSWTVGRLDDGSMVAPGNYKIKIKEISTAVASTSDGTITLIP